MPIIDRSNLYDISGDHIREVTYNDLYFNNPDLGNAIKPYITPINDDIALTNSKLELINDNLTSDINKLKCNCALLLNKINDLDHIIKSQKEKQEQIKTLGRWKRFKMILKFIFKGEIIYF